MCFFLSFSFWPFFLLVSFFSYHSLLLFTTKVSHISFALLSFSIYLPLKGQLSLLSSNNLRRYSTMAMSIIYATVPAVAAIVGIYSFDRNHPKAKGFGDGTPASIGSMVAKAKEEVKTTQLPKLAPQFDGLHCFETFVGH